jgi:hypothetical protein
MSKEEEFYKELGDCVSDALDEMGDEIHDLSIHCRNDSIVHINAQETEQDPNQLNDRTYEGYLGDGEYAD